MTAPAWVHRRDKLEPGWIGDVSLGPGDADAAGLERLPERLESRTVKLGQLVKKQHPPMGK